MRRGHQNVVRGVMLGTEGGRIKRELRRIRIRIDKTGHPRKCPWGGIMA